MEKFEAWKQCHVSVEKVEAVVEREDELFWWLYREVASFIMASRELSQQSRRRGAWGL